MLHAHRRQKGLVGLVGLASCTALVALGTGCPEPPRPVPPARGTVHVRAATDASAVRLMVTAGSFLFAAGAHGVDRWSPGDGTVLPLSSAHGLPGDRVLAMASDRERMWLWIATDGGLGYYDVTAETFTELASSKVVDVSAARAPGEVHLAPAADGGVWIGHPLGLFYTNPAGQWAATAITGRIAALALGEDGWLWIGTLDGLIGRKPTGETFRYGPADGCDVVKARLIVRAPGGGVLVVGESGDGKQRVAIRKAGAWASYKVSPEVRIDHLAARGDGLIAMGGRKLYALDAVGTGKRRLLTRDGVRLLPVGRETGVVASPVTIDPLPAVLPQDATDLAVVGDEILVGTRDVGIARLDLEATQPEGWLRRRQLLEGATTLTVACRAKDDCLLATGARRAWRFDGEVYEPTGPESQAVLAVVRDHHGAVYALHRAGDAAAIEVSRVEGEDWTSTGMQIKTPGDRPEVSFARFGPGGMLWVGLRYTDGKDLRPWGVALVDLEVGAVAYHHATTDRKERKQGVLPVPIDVVDGAFAGDDEVWLATTEGAARLVGDDITVWNETNGMASELIRAIAVSPGGFVFVATGAGVGLFDGEAWSFPRELSFEVADLAIATDGKLWMATSRGVALYDGKKVKRLDVRRGLLENDIVDIALDEHGRVWARGAESLTVITP